MHLTIMVTAFSVCLALGLAGIKAAPSLGLLDIPGGRRQHIGHVPRVGGLALNLTLLCLSIFPAFRLPLTWLEALAVSAMAILGFLDDRLELRARWKAGLGLSLALILAGATLHHISPLPATLEVLGIPLHGQPGFAFALLAIMFWCLPHAFNLVDGANGLATGFALVVVGTLWAKNLPQPALAGALLACLFLNWPKAHLFLGDSGSLSIGLLLVISAQKFLLMPDPGHVLWLFAYPTIDVVTVIAIRIFARKPIMVGDRNHLHFQIKDRWPVLSDFSVPILLTLAAMCGSEVYLSGPWVAIPYAGLGALLGLAAYLTTVTALKIVREEYATGDAPSPERSDLDADGSHPEPKVLHKPQWQERVSNS